MANACLLLHTGQANIFNAVSVHLYYFSNWHQHIHLTVFQLLKVCLFLNQIWYSFATFGRLQLAPSGFVSVMCGLVYMWMVWADVCEDGLSVMTVCGKIRISIGSLFQFPVSLLPSRQHYIANPTQIINLNSKRPTYMSSM